VILNDISCVTDRTLVNMDTVSEQMGMSSDVVNCFKIQIYKM